MLSPMRRVRIPIRLARMLMNGKRETSPRRVANRGFSVVTAFARKASLAALASPTGLVSVISNWDIKFKEQGKWSS